MVQMRAYIHGSPLTFCWVNYLYFFLHMYLKYSIFLERISNPAKTVAALDLGGGSTQVTFSALTPASLSQREYIHQAKAPKGLIQVYTNSFLGLGLMAARKEVISKGKAIGNNVTSECVNPVVKGKRLHFAGEDFYVSGLQENYPVKKEKGYISAEEPVIDFEYCSNIIVDYVKSKAKPLEELPHKQIFAFSYYFDRAVEVGLIDELKGGQVEVDSFRIEAEKGKFLIIVATI